MYVLHHAPDNASLIVRLVLDGAGLDYRLAPVDRDRLAVDKTDYLRVTPTALIPALETPHGTIFETGAILLWLGDRHGLVPPPDHEDRGGMLAWLFFLSNTLHADLLGLFYARKYVPEAAIPANQALLIGRLIGHLTLLDRAAAERPALFAQGGILLPYLLTLVRWSALYPDTSPRWLRLGDFPKLQALAAAYEGLSSTKATALADGLGAFPFTLPVDDNPAQPD